MWSTLTTAVAIEPVIAELDRPLIQRVVSNLVANAVAHTPPGGTVVLGANADVAAITSRLKLQGGTGLGLAIVQRIMVLHCGRAEITSQPGEGTRVTLHIPVAR